MKGTKPSTTPTISGGEFSPRKDWPRQSWTRDTAFHGAVRDRRRAANKMARVSRRINRRAA